MHRNKHGVRAVPIRKEDEVMVVRGSMKNKEGKVIQCYRKKWVIHVERITRDKVNGATAPVGIHPSKVRATPEEWKSVEEARISMEEGVSSLYMCVYMPRSDSVEYVRRVSLETLTSQIYMYVHHHPHALVCLSAPATTTLATTGTLFCGTFTHFAIQVIITKLKLDKDRKALLERKKGASTTEKGKGKFSEAEVQAMQDVD